MSEASYPALDVRQIKRIEAVHGGFLYQHLYAVGCLFSAAKSGVSAVGVEPDEDNQNRNYCFLKAALRREILKQEIGHHFFIDRLQGHAHRRRERFVPRCLDRFTLQLATG